VRLHDGRSPGLLGGPPRVIHGAALVADRPRPGAPSVLVGSGARGAERLRTITFESESRTIIITVAGTPDGRVRVDGWLAPAGRMRVELRLGGATPDTPAASESVVSDDSGRFAFDGIGHGLARLLVHPIDDGDESSIVTPSLVL